MNSEKSERLIITFSYYRYSVIFFIYFIYFWQCCGSKYIEFGSGSRILAQFMLSILKINKKIILDNKKLLEKITFFNTKVPNTDLIWIRIHNWLV